MGSNREFNGSALDQPPPIQKQTIDQIPLKNNQTGNLIMMKDITYTPPVKTSSKLPKESSYVPNSSKITGKAGTMILNSSAVPVINPETIRLTPMRGSKGDGIQLKNQNNANMIIN